MDPTQPTPFLQIDISIPSDFNREDSLAVQDVWRKMQKLATERELTADECALMIEVTRILRRTHTGPAKAKTSKAGKKKPDLAAISQSLLD